MAESPRIEDLRAQARHHRERLDLYRAKMYGLRPTTMTRLRELERIEQAAKPVSAKPNRIARRTLKTDRPAALRPPSPPPFARSHQCLSRRRFLGETRCYLIATSRRPPQQRNPRRNAGPEQSGRPDLNRGPRRPERRALPGCATPRCTPESSRSRLGSSARRGP